MANTSATSKPIFQYWSRQSEFLADRDLFYNANDPLSTNEEVLSAKEIRKNRESITSDQLRPINEGVNERAKNPGFFEGLQRIYDQNLLLFLQNKYKPVPVPEIRTSDIKAKDFESASKISNFSESLTGIFGVSFGKDPFNGYSLRENIGLVSSHIVQNCMYYQVGANFGYGSTFGTGSTKNFAHDYSTSIWNSIDIFNKVLSLRFKLGWENMNIYSATTNSYNSVNLISNGFNLTFNPFNNIKMPGFLPDVYRLGADITSFTDKNYLNYNSVFTFGTEKYLDKDLIAILNFKYSRDRVTPDESAFSGYGLAGIESNRTYPYIDMAGIETGVRYNSNGSQYMALLSYAQGGYNAGSVGKIRDFGLALTMSPRNEKFDAIDTVSVKLSRRQISDAVNKKINENRVDLQWTHRFGIIDYNNKKN